MNNGHTNYDENLFQLPSRASLYLIQLALSNVFPPESSPYIESLLRLITVLFRKHLNFLSLLSRMPWEYYGEVIGTFSQKNSE